MDRARLSPHGADLAARYSGDFVHPRPGGRRLVLDGAPKPLVVSEFGGLSYTPTAGQDWHGYATVATGEEFLDRMSGLLDALLTNPAVAGFC